MGIGDFIDSAKSAVGDAYDAAKDVVVDTGTAIQNDVEQVVETVKETVEPAVDATIDAAKGAVQWGQHQADQASRMLQDKLFGGETAPATDVEGRASINRSNSGDPNQKIDLGSDEKVGEFLKTFGQKDKLDETTSDRARCQSNVIVAGLLTQGGLPKLQSGLESAKKNAQEQLAASPPPTGEKKAALDKAVGDFDKALGGIKTGNLTRGDLDRASDALFHTASTGDQYGQKDAQGRLQTAGIDPAKMNEMERLVGLTGEDSQEVGEKSWINPAGWGLEDNEEVAANVWDKIEAGKSAHVGVNIYGEHAATRTGPNGEKVQFDKDDKPYFISSTNSEKVMLEENVNHAVLFGKTKEGNRYIYDPNAEPPYMTEKPGDPASTAALDEMSRRLMANKGNDDYRAKVTRFS